MTRLTLTAVACATLIIVSFSPSVVRASGVVGTGTAGSCTAAALDGALAGGGLVTFNCGGGLVTIYYGREIDADTTIDGGNLITISGGHSVSVFIVDAGVNFTVQNLTIANGNAGSGGAGGGIYNAGATLTVTNSTFSGNSAGDGGVGGGSGAGGGIYNDSGTLTVTNSTFSGNSAVGPGNSGVGGGIYNDSGTLTVTNSTFSGNSAGDGGGLENGGTLTVTNSTFSDNSARVSGGAGGGIDNSNSSTLMVTNSTFSGNSAGSGGGISSGGTLTVTNSTFSDNSGASGFVGGGGIACGGALTVTNSTFSGNSAVGDGGGIFSGGTLTVTNSTFSGNSAGGGGGGGIYSNGTGTVTNTIVANSTAGGNCAGNAVTDGGHNIDDGTTCGFTGTGCSVTTGTSFCNTDPVLDPTGLQNNGGPTQTIALCAGTNAPRAGCTGPSPGINAGNESVCSTTTGTAPVANHDQRGVLRPGAPATHCSIGAYESDFVRGLIPGQGKNGCMLEWFTEPATAVGRNHLPVHQLTCTDDNPLCDFGAPGNHTCTFHVAACLNIVDPRLPCVPTDVAQVQLLSPNEANPKDSKGTAIRDAMESALVGIGGTVDGLCSNTGTKGQLCAADVDCDSPAGSGNGVCRGRFVAFAPPLTTDTSCTALAPIQVPLNQTLTGFRAASVTLSVKATSDPASKPTDHNRLTLTCKPHP